MKFKFLVLMFIGCLTVQGIVAQSLSNYNLYTINKYVINPAYTGSEDGVFSALHFKNHFTGIANAPRNLSFVLHSPIGNKLGLGGNITVGQAGVFRSTSSNIAASYKVTVASDHRITFGLSGGFTKQMLDNDKLSGVDLSDPTLESGYNDKVFYKFGFGALYNWKNLEVSLAFPNAKQEERNLLSNYFIGYASYKFYTANKDWEFRPSILYKSLPVTSDQVDVYLMSQWKNLLWAQAGYRTNNNIVFGAGITIENLNLGYAYEAPTGTRDVSKGTHEVVLTFLLKKKAPKTVDVSGEGIKNNSLSDSTYAHIKELESELELLKQQVGELSHFIEVDTVRHSKDTIYIYSNTSEHKKLQAGNYIVVQNCKTKDFAYKIQKMYNAKGISTYLAYNETQNVFYVIEKYFSTYDQAKYELEKLKKKGYKNVWIMVY